MQKNLINLLKFLVGWPLSFLALFFIYQTFAPKLDSVDLSFQDLHLSLLFFGVICFILYYFLRSYIWYVLLRNLSYTLPFKESNYLWLSSQLKRYIPGNIWSILGMTVVYSEKKVEKKDIVYGTLVEAQVVIVSGALVSLLAVPFLLEQFLSFLPYKGHITFLIILITLIGTGIFIFNRNFFHRVSFRQFSAVEHVFPRFKPRETLILVLLMGGSFLLYGLGYYFAISAVVVLPPELLITLIGLFVFSLMMGFLSVVVPSGLGIREGFITLGLSKIIPLPVAGFGAIFSRIILVCSEIVTLLIAYAWYRFQTKKGEKVEQKLSRNPHEAFLWIGIAIFTLYFTIVNFLRYTNFYTGRFDLGNMSQVVWNTFHGRIFEFSPPFSADLYSRLSYHADFILILLAPFYLLWEDPRMLLFIQTLVVGLGALFVYKLTFLVIKNKHFALLLAIVYLLNPSLQRTVIYDFHAVTLVTTFLLGAFYYLLQKKYRWFFVFAVLAALTKEQVWVILALFGLYIVIVQRNVRLGVSLFVLSSFIFYFLIWHAMPQALGGNHFALEYFAGSEEGPSGVLKQIVLSPMETIQSLMTKSRYDYLKALFLPLGLFSFLGAPFLIFAGPDLAINLLSKNPQLHQIYYQYTAVINAFIFIAAIMGIGFFRKKFPRVPLIAYASVIIVFSTYSAYKYGPLPGSREANLAMFTKQRETKGLIKKQLTLIPTDATVAASNNIGTQLSHREHIYTLPYGREEAEYVVALTSAGSKEDAAFSLLGSPDYITLYADDELIILKRRLPLQ